MKRKVICSAVVLALGVAMASGTSLAAQGGNGGGNGGGNRPPVESANNLSFPAVLKGGTVTLPGVPGQYSLAGQFPESMSFGCAIPEALGTYSYPNTSCVTTDGAPLPYAQCQQICGDVPVERIYWQKQAANVWQAQNYTETLAPVANFVDWGDNLESVTWTASSSVRVEVTPFATLPIEQLGFHMWHVFGQGPSELWGVRSLDAPDITAPGVPYGYTTPYAIIRTPNARLNLAKLSPAADTCGGLSPYASTYSWNVAMPNKWGAIEVDDLAFTPELNIGGKFVYGYNWATKRTVMPAGVDKVGWWRLTFYAPGDVLFDANAVTAPPELPDSAPLPPNPSMMTRITISADTGPLYFPVVDAVNHITYIDICLAEGKGNSGRPR